MRLHPPIDRLRRGALLALLALPLGLGGRAMAQDFGAAEWAAESSSCPNCKIPWEEGQHYRGSGGPGRSSWDPCDWGPHCTPCYSAETEEQKRAMLAACPDCHVNWGHGYSDLPPPGSDPIIRWYASLDAAPLIYDGTRDIKFASFDPGTDFVVSTNDLDLLLEGGGRLVVGYALDNYWRVEALYLGGHEWEDSASFRDNDPNIVGGTGNLFSPFTGFGNPAVLGLDFNEFARIDLRTEFQNIELIVRHRSPLRCGAMELSTLCGLRYTQIDEDFRYFTVANVPPAAGATNEMDVVTENRLLGFQLGALMNYAVSDWWRIDIEVRAALCQNLAKQQTVYSNTNNLGVTTLFNGEEQEGVTAVVGDVSVVHHYQLSDNVALRLGYQATFVDGIALAAENFERDLDVLTLGPADLNHNGTAIYHGPLLGLTVAW